MGKQKKIKTSKTARDGFLAEREPLKRTERSKARPETYDDEVVDDKLTRKILDQARRQQEELQEEHGVKSEVKKTVRLGEGGSDSEAEGDDEALGGAEAAYYEDVEKVSEEDERALEQFMSKEAPARRTLADIIQEKLTEKKTEIHTLMSDDASVNVEEMDERVVKMYRQIRDILAKYRSGKLPKAFKIIPGLANWEQILYLTEPDRWSAAAMYQATRIFSSNLNAKMAQRFYNLVLYPRIRDDISEYKRLNFHLYMALKKSLFKPAAFFKGILLPLCESGTCTLREAVIVSSVIAKNSIPLLQSSAALLKMAEMPYSGAASIFLKTLLDKKYALPYRVIDAVVFHFLQFKTDKRTLPVLWHQCLLCFVQRYKNDMSPEQKEALLELLRIHVHDSMTPEIRREISKS